MSTLSDPTLGLLIEIAEDRFSASELRNLLMRADLDKYDEGWATNKHELLRRRLLGARDEALDGAPDANRALLAFVKMIVVKAVRFPQDPPPWFEDLREALRADGYELRWDYPTERSGDQDIFTAQVQWQVLPTDAAPVPLGSEITALEATLAHRGYQSSLNHYRQAVDNLMQHNFEAANGQLRTMLEDLVVNIAKAHGYVGQGKAGEGGPAIRHLVDHATLLPERDGGQLLKGLWAITHTNGAHPGQSDASEARLRMQLITGTAQFLLNYFPPTH